MAEKSQGPVVAFFDVDGTLTCRDFNVGLHVNPTPRVEAAIRAFVGAGNVAVVCSGRSVVNLSDLAHLPFSGYVTLDGTHVIYDDEVISTPELTIPHPGIAEREFVLTPLCEVLRQRPHPVLGLTMGELRDNLLRKTK